MSGLSGTNNYMGGDPRLNISNSPLANAPPNAEMEEFNFFGNNFLSDIKFAPGEKPKEMTNNIVLVNENSSKELQLVKNSVENTHVFDANKTQENSPIKAQTITEPKTNLLANDNFSKIIPLTSQKDLKKIKANELIFKEEKLSHNQAAIEVKNDLILKSSISKIRVIKANPLKNELEFVHENKINATLLKNDPNVFFLHENGMIIMTAEQKELHGENLARYSFSNKNISSEDLEKFKKNFNPDNIFICTNDQFNILNNKLMNKTTETKEKKDEKQVNSKNKEGQVIEKSDKSAESLTVSTIDLIKNSIVGIFASSSRKMDSAKEEQAIQKRDQKKFREKKETLEAETNKIIIENIHRKVQENNRPKH